MSDKSVQLAAQVAVFGMSVAGYVALAIVGEATVEYVTLVGPVLGAMIVMRHLRGQDEKLDQINENTNGVLTRRIRDGVRAALDERDSGAAR